MNYKVDFDSLDAFYTDIVLQTKDWKEELETIKLAIQVLQESSNMSGATAESVRDYMGGVHISLISLLEILLRLHSYNCLIYKNEHQNVDDNLHAVIDLLELNEIKSVLEKEKKKAITVDDNLYYILCDVKDIFKVSCTDIESVDNAHKTAISKLTELIETIYEIEKSHKKRDFTTTSELINTIEEFILEQLSYNRKYKSNFDMKAFASSNSFKKLCEASLKVSCEFDEKEVEINTAISNENQRVAALQEELEERQKIATAINWGVTGVCIIGSIAAIVLTGGAATPLVIGGISAASSVVIAGTGNMTSQYVEHGNIIENSEDLDWSSFGKDVAVSGVTGFVTGYIGAGVGGAITNKLTTTSVGNAMLNSTNSFARIGTGAAIGSVSEVSSGVVSRGVGTYIYSGFDAEEAIDDAFDLKNIMVDAALGGTSGGFEQVSSIYKAQAAADQTSLEYNTKYNPLEAGKEKGLENLKQTQNGGVDFSDSDYILRTDSGAPIEVKIKSTGVRGEDYALAEQVLKEEYGIDIDLRSMRTGQKKTHVWHHMDDYNVMTNETTMQFIEIDAHKAIANHSGSVSQYHIAHGSGYGKQQLDVNYEGVKILDYVSPVVNNASKTNENISQFDLKKISAYIY